MEINQLTILEGSCLDKKLICDLCDTTDIMLVYEPVGTRRNLKVYICESCGLVQSFPKVDHVDERNVAVSGGANWGNIRYGKGFRTKHDIDLINEYKNITEFERCLDIGSNRGNFIQSLLKKNSHIEVWAVEPDGNILGDYPVSKKIRVINDRIENIDLPDDYFDLIYCSHTLEHLKSPRKTLIEISSSITRNGLLYIEVPNIEFLNTTDIIEEWFIDKHLYHFSRNLLLQYLKKVGFNIIHCSDELVRENISIIIQKNGTKNHVQISDYQKNRDLVKTYFENININHKRVKKLACYLNDLGSRQKLVVWGAGRIFDNLVKIGGLDLTKVHGLIDKYLVDFVSESNHLKINKPSELKKLDPDNVVVCSREYFREIRREIKNHLPEVSIIGFSQIMKNIT